MANERMTDREAILVARIKHLEDAAKAQAVSVARAGAFEATWRTINAIIPTWLAGVALAVFLAHHAFSYYLQAQITEAETRLQYAKADIEKAQSDALNGKVADEPMRLATLRAELVKKRAEASQAMAEAQAQSAQLERETTRLAALKAQLASLQNQAALARAKANAEGARFGLQTLEERAVRAKLILQRFEIIHNRVGAALPNAIAANGVANAIVRAFCEDNQFADLIGCPAQYITRRPTSAPPPAAITAAQPRDGPHNDTTSPTRALRTPTMFKCANRFLSVDYVVCDNPQLMDAMARLEDAYRNAVAVGGDNVKKSQRAWSLNYGPSCGLTGKGPPSETVSQSTRDCVFRAMNQRIAGLQNSASN